MWIIYSIGAAIAGTATNALRKRETLRDHNHNGVINLATFCFAIPILLVVNIAFGFPVIQRGYWIFLLGHLVVDFIAFICFVQALRSGQISLVTPFISFISVFAAILAPFVIGQQTTLGGMVGIFLCVVGAYLINRKKGHGLLTPFQGMFHNKGILFALTAAFFWSIGAMFLRLGQTYSSVWFHPLMLTIGLTGLFTLKVLFLDRKNFITELQKDLQGHATLGFTYATEISLITLAVATGPVAYAVAIKQLSLLFDIVVGKTFFGEDNYRQRLIAGLIIVTGIVVIVLWG
jgi:drug/metabolite transporter (DMT)-like permease